MNFKERQCKDCGGEFKPRTHIDKLCDACKLERRKDRESKNPWHNVDVQASRGYAVSKTPMAIDLERSVARRVEKMK